ncbi:hypothetical protein [Salibacterium halotolerans]|uniref:Hook-length control protein FliK n=1 Tax=Salibacterium halotolerans TaxID=1884432 RepID=A0A1I5NRW6_9BACI|nr:hypothetical protein [Salibacterium halotolerans]SFP24417.1 hypothetical protein SAMN05518683_103252 [Salibacterium halotolerans]
MQAPTYSFSGRSGSGAARMQEGGVYRGRILEQNSKGGALLDLQGTKIKASFQGGMPSNNQVAFQVTGNKEGALQVRVLQEQSGGNAVALKTSGILKQMGVQNPSEGMTKAANIMLQSGSPLTKDSAASVQRFMEQVDGTREQKLNTIKAAAGKEVSMTSENLRSIHESLHKSRQTSDFINEWTSSKAGSGSDGVPQIEKVVQRALQAASASQNKEIREAAAAIKQNLQQGGSLNQAVQAVKNNILSHPDLSREAAAALEKAVQEAEFLAGTGQDRLMQALQNVLSEKQGAASDSDQLFRHIQALVSSSVSGADNQELQRVLQQSGIKKNDMNRMVKLTDQMVQLEESGRGRLVNTLDQWTGSGAASSSEQGGAPAAGVTAAAAFQANAAQAAAELRASIPLETKPMLETTITNRMVRITDEFQQMQQNTIKQLEQTGKMLEQNRQTAPQAKQVLEAAIHKLDRSILRSDFTLFTDMKTERSMLQASTRLSEARQLLSSGDVKSAWKVVDEVRQSVQAMEFKASEQKVKQVIAREETAARNMGMQRAVQYTADQARAALQEPSSRQVFELVRTLGLNREQEIGQMLTTSQRQQSQNVTMQQNMKDALMQLMKHENDSSLQQKSSQALSNLTGQQLMSKTDQGNNMQQLLFNLPVPMKENMEDLQVYVQARQDQGEMDWENCNLYFLIETPSLGETGIMVHAFDRQLAITLKNDDPDFEKTMAPLVDQAAESINEIGYNIQDIRYQPMSTASREQTDILNQNNEFEAEERPEPVDHPFETMKGFDYKI